jgi:hypothetical protein
MNEEKLIPELKIRHYDYVNDNIETRNKSIKIPFKIWCTMDVDEYLLLSNNIDDVDKLITENVIKVFSQSLKSANVEVKKILDAEREKLKISK